MYCVSIRYDTIENKVKYYYLKTIKKGCMNVPEQFGIVPIVFATLEAVLGEYKYP